MIRQCQNYTSFVDWKICSAYKCSLRFDRKTDVFHKPYVQWYNYVNKVVNMCSNVMSHEWVIVPVCFVLSILILWFYWSWLAYIFKMLLDHIKQIPNLVRDIFNVFLCIPNVFNKHCILTIGNRQKILCCRCNILRNSYFYLLIFGQDCQYQ